MNERVLILPIGNYGFIPFSKKKNIYVKQVFNGSKDNLFRRAVHKAFLLKTDLFLQLPIKFQTGILKYIYSNWFNLLNKVDTIIAFDDKRENIPLLKMIHQLYPSKRLILWYWNNVDKSSVQPGKIDRKYIELWSFDPEDCKKYNMNYNVQFYPTENVKQINSKIKYDILYVGANKSQKRMDVLEKIKQKCEIEKIPYNFYVVKQFNKDLNTSISYRPFLKYSEILKLINETRGILDIIKENQSGLTLRPLEALFFDKKLITNNEKIVQHKIYNLNSENIYILGKDKRKLKDFVEMPVRHADNTALKHYYSFDNWLNNFFK